MLSRRKVYLFSKFAFLLSSLSFSHSLQRPLSREPRLSTKDAGARTPIVVTTWAIYGFQDACTAALGVLNRTSSGYGGVLDAVESGARHCEETGCSGSVGAGSHPDESGETTLDALIMRGDNHKAGAVGSIRFLPEASGAARAVLESTFHTLLVGEAATRFAMDMGLREASLSSNDSQAQYDQWLKNSCQPNYRTCVTPDPKASCGPYRPLMRSCSQTRASPYGPIPLPPGGWDPTTGHDTIGLVAMGADGAIACGTSTNGAAWKIPGRVGDASIPGSGCYVDDEAGGCAATGDGDVLMRFSPCARVVWLMQTGLKPQQAAEQTLSWIARKHGPAFYGALVAVDVKGRHGGASWGFGASFAYSVGTLGKDASKGLECAAIPVPAIGPPS